MESGHNRIRTLYLSGLFCAFLITILGGLRWPSDWAEAHWLISYQFGFLKRALPGTIIAPLTSSGDAELVIRNVSIIVLLAFCLAVFWICYRTVSNSLYSTDSILVILVFLTSSYIVMSAHLIGYFDHLIILITITACRLVIDKRIWQTTILISVGILIHETIFFVGYPSVVFLAFISQAKELQTSTNKAFLSTFIRRFRSIVFIPLIVLFSVLIIQTIFLDTASVGMQVASHLEKHDFIQENRHVFVAYALTASFTKQLINQSQYFLQRLLSAEFLIIIGFPLSLIYLHVWNCLSGLRFRAAIRLAFLLILLLPLFLHSVAWDTSRIWTYPLIVGMLGLWSISEVFPRATRQFRFNFPLMIALLSVVVLQIFATTALMDGAEEPFSVVDRMLYYAPSLLLIGLATRLQVGMSTGPIGPTD